MQAFGYPGILLVVLIENLFPPIPSEIVLPFAGFLTQQGSLTFIGVLIASTLGSVLGAIALYYLGRWLGRDRIYLIVNRYGKWLTVTEENVQTAETWFTRYGTWTVFFCRMVPIIRSLISIPAGLIDMNLVTFTIYTTFGTLIWNTVLVGLGALLGANWHRVIGWIDTYQNIVLGLLILLFIAFVAYQVTKKRQ